MPPGLTPEDYPSEDVEVWPENHQAFVLFRKMQTQWWTGPGGRTGLNHLVLLARLDRMGLTPEEYDMLDDDIRAMEIAALNEINKD